MSASRRVAVALAGPGDDGELRRLLRDNPMPGWVTVSLQREPSFFLGTAVEGDDHQTIVGRLEGDGAGGRLVGLGSWSVRPRWVNGVATPVVYLSQLRIDPEFRRSRGLLRRGFSLFRTLHEEHRVPLCVTTIFEENWLGRLVLEPDRPYKPCYRRVGRLVSLAVPLWRRLPTAAAGLALRRATAADRDAIVACLERNQRRYQLAPRWTAADLASGERARGLRAADFHLALRGARVVGCLAVWDQQAYKQVVIHGYRGPLALGRPLWNRVAARAGWPRLPDPGERLGHAYLSHVAVDDDDPEAARALLGAGANDARERGHAFVTLGFCDGHPLLAVARRTFFALEHRALVYVAFWEDGRGHAARLDGRPPHLEVAVL